MIWTIRLMSSAAGQRHALLFLPVPCVMNSLVPIGMPCAKADAECAVLNTDLACFSRTRGDEHPLQVGAPKHQRQAGLRTDKLGGINGEGGGLDGPSSQARR